MEGTERIPYYLKKKKKEKKQIKQVTLALT